MIEDGETIPAASTLETVMAERAHREAVAFLVKAPAQHARAVRVNTNPASGSKAHRAAHPPPALDCPTPPQSRCHR
jgi:hypothetical protein